MFSNTVNQHISRAMTWTEMIASKINDEYDFESKFPFSIPRRLKNICEMIEKEAI